MPKISWNDVTESRGGGVSTLPSGAYKCQITKAEFVTTKKGAAALVVVWDVAEGEHKGHFSEAFFEGKDFRHNDYLMLEGKALGMTKHKLHALADANPGFKPTAAIDQDQAQPFVGKTLPAPTGAQVHLQRARPERGQRRGLAQPRRVPRGRLQGARDAGRARGAARSSHRPRPLRPGR